MNFYELKISLNLKAPIHFQKSPEALSKLLATALINSGYELHYKNIPKNYVFSNLGKANEKGFFEGEKEFYFRSFDKDLVRLVNNSLCFYEDNLFKIGGIEFKEVKYKKIDSMISLNPVFVVMKDGNFWSFEKNGNLSDLFKAIHSNLVRKYEMIFNKKINPTNSFIEYLQIKNNKPQTYFYKGVKFFGWKFYIIPRSDEISQKLAFVALGTGLGHKNSSVGGGFMKWKIKN